MTNSLVIGLYPTAPTDEATFETFLHDLSIMAYQVDFDNPRTAPPPPKHIEIGTATYKNQADPKNTIYQLKKPVPFQPKKTMAAAAAVIPLPPSIDPRFLKPAYLVNVVLDVQRKGVHLVDHSINYDIQPADVTPPIDALDGVNVGLYLALTNPATDPGGPITYLVPPSDGTPPAYQDLDAAVKAILPEDPATKVDTANMSPADCLHIARELVSNRTPRPLPAPLAGSSADLGELYTASPNGTGTNEDRAKFQGALLGYYNQLSYDATRMAGYIYAWSAAQKCQQLSKAAANAAMSLPVRLKTTNSAGQQAKATLNLGDLQMDPSFEVDAQYFYALGAQWPIGVAAMSRFTLATAPSETKLAAQLQTAMDTGVIGQNPGGNSPLQAARRLVALGAARASTQLGDERTYTVRPTVDVHNDLVTVTNGLVTGVPNATALQFSIIEALYARGFTSIDSIIALDQADFSQALTGSVAFQWAGEIWKKGFFYDVIPRERPLGPLSTECAAECWG